MQDILIGIDPGRSNGFAVWDITGQKLLSLQTLNFWEVFKQIIQFGALYKLRKVVIENPGLNKPVFMSKEMKKDKETAFDKMLNARLNPDQFVEGMEEIESIIRIQSSKAQKVGMNKKYADLLIEWCKMNNLDVAEIRPYLKKMDAEQFREYTGWTQRTNEHNRDAARLIFGT